ncbi:phosphatase 2C-like domain-containing protein [Pyronema domesticum]|uniref:Protein phosphatase n=1 Tax=Pyronema omphalodes (strain CBS 100304) TaxID=1076935 RepID=U4LG22_PYROM|nr:phosphatase 2C-like domain-containing protein [Pyronema domesticum]CCX30848.1 Similar to Protein phosphatase PTC7 homolog fig; acc. no. B4JYN1 [Pyronema omphalodes CBS 100304]
MPHFTSRLLRFAVPSTRQFSTTRNAAAMKYHIACAYSSKGTTYHPERDLWTLTADSTIPFPHRDVHRSDAGQDAFFVSRPACAPGSVAVGIADGVTRFGGFDFDSTFFSQGLCARMAEAEPVSSAVEIISIGFDKLKMSGNIFGGSTACVALFDREGNVSTANLGDSGLVILRAGKGAYQTKTQRMIGGAAQLAIPPLEMEKEIISDLPGTAYLDEHKIQHGDVVLLATDGLWDNLKRLKDANTEDPGSVIDMVTEAMVGCGAWVKNAQGGQESVSVYPGLEHMIATKTDGIESCVAKTVLGKVKVASDKPEGKKDDITVMVVFATAEGGERDMT